MYVIQTAGWCAAGFVAGFLAGRAARDVHRIADAVTTKGETMTDVTRRRWWDRSKTRIVIAAIVVGLGILTVAQGLVQSAAIRRITNCQTTFSNQFADALEARSLASQQAQDALDELMTVVGRLGASPPANPAEAEERRETYRKAITGYLDKRAAVRASQQRNPYPKPPREACPTS